MSERRPPGPITRFPVKHVFAVGRDMLGFFQRLSREYGDVAFLMIGRNHPTYVITHPDLVREVLVTQQKSFVKGRSIDRLRRILGNGLLTSGGEFHLRQRRLAQPAFHRQRVAEYAKTMTAYTARLSDGWHDGETLDVSKEMTRLTLAVASKTLFDADVESETAEIGATLSDAIDAFNIAILPYANLLDKLPLPITRRLRRARIRLDETIYRIIAERRRSGTDRGDLLSMLLLARDTEADGGQMTDEQLRDEVMTIFIAGHETTALALTWTWYLLARHPEIEARLQAEVDSVLRDPSGDIRVPTADDLPRLEYTRRVLAEALRLYPPIWAAGRRAIAEVRIGEYTLPIGSLVLVSQYLVHHDPRWWPDPERFDPERWVPAVADARPRFSYFPFGGGTRICIGEQFAWMEGTLVLAVLVSRWRLKLTTPKPIEIHAMITLRPKGPVNMTLERRDHRGAWHGQSSTRTPEAHV
jgi:cytochrome P450